MRYKVTVAYDGSNYAGFQSQINALAIQDVIEKALKTIFRKDIKIVMSSRTDAGVHAKGQVFHFDVDTKKDEYKIKYSLNGLLPKDIHILKVEKVSNQFHARFSVKNKTYEYLINVGEYDVFSRNYAFQCFYDLDYDLLLKGAKLFVGTHDFSSFNTNSYSEYPDQTRTIDEFKVTRSKDIIKIRVTSSGFFRNQVRIMVGTLIDLARGQKTLKEVQEMFDHPCKSTRRYNADPHGLYLIKVRY